MINTRNLILFLVALMIIYKFRNKNVLEHLKIIELNKVGYHRCNSYPIGKVNGKILKSRGQIRDNKDWYWYFPCGYNDAEKEITKINIKDETQKIFIIDGCDYIVSKFTLWQILKLKYGRDKASNILPNSFLSYKKKDLNEFWNFYNKQITENKYSKFILKKDLQRKEGINIVRSKEEINKLIQEDKYVIQEYLNDPLTIDGHKVNLRYYLLVVCSKDKKQAYLHSNGVTHYTLEQFSENSLDFYKNITSSYEDREDYEKLYQNRPFSISEFHYYLKTNNYNLDKYIGNLTKCLKLVLDASQDFFCKIHKDNVKFQLFGCDIAPDKYMGVKLMELNKGPNMIPRNEHDEKVKLKVVNHILDIVDDQNIIDLEENNDFMKIWEV